jgi:hypothetical protein
MHVAGILEGSRRLWRASHGGEPCTLFKIDAPGIKLSNEGEQELFNALSDLKAARALWWQGDLKEKEQPGILQAIHTKKLCKVQLLSKGDQHSMPAEEPKRQQQFPVCLAILLAGLAGGEAAVWDAEHETVYVRLPAADCTLEALTKMSDAVLARRGLTRKHVNDVVSRGSVSRGSICICP